ncbi:dolichyl-P-Man:Man(5)GlcNAc(2)-PP-dolichol alpha-1,3-mannosyltransferase, partial [Tulasnella sp. 427]
SLLRALLLDRRYFWALACLAIAADAVLTQLVIRFIGFTEIDYETYIEHIAVFAKGERDYSLITGPSGPLVYPAGHVWIHWVLRHFTADRNTGAILIRTAQQIYGVLYLWTLLVACRVYQQAGTMPNYAILPLIFSKRLHSIFVLRLFNDCWAVAVMMTAVAAYQKRWFKVGTALYALALSVKMNILLYLPGILVVLVHTTGLLAALGHITLIIGIQGLLAVPFLSTYPREYLSNAFNLSRVFLYKWTVNWRFVPEETFLSLTFAKLLLLVHVVLLVVFGSKWCQPDGGVPAVVQRTLAKPKAGSGVTPMSPDRISTILFTSNLIGIVVARSLHYQFYSWYAQQLPFLIWHTKYPIPISMSTPVDESNFKEYQESTTVTLEWTVRNLKQLFDGSRGDQKSKVHKSVRFGGGRWQILLYPNSGHEGGYVSLYLSCEPTQEEKDNAINGKWTRDGLFKFSFDLKTVNRPSPGVFNTKEACDHAFSYKTANWGWAQFAKRDVVYYSAPQVKAADAFLIVCTITSSPVKPVQPPTAARQYVPKGLMDAVGSMLDDPLYSDVEFVLPSRKRLGKTKRIYANKKILSRAEYFDTMFQSGFSETGIVQDIATPSLGRRDSITSMDDDAHSLDDSDESDAETETDQLKPFFELRSPQRAKAGSSTRDSTWETQSDIVVVRSGAKDDEDMSDEDQGTATVGGDTSIRGPVINLGEQNDAAEDDVEMDKSQRPATPRVVRPQASHPPGVQREVQGPRQETVPGPPKARVVVRDVAHATYFALLYYLYTDCINFAPLSSSFLHVSGPY